jgi:hypothetical protein
MTLDKIKLYTAQERIKAYIYFGIEAEMELIQNRIERSLLDPDEEKNVHEIQWYDKYEQTFQHKIERANSRISDIEVYIGVMHESNT